MDALTLDFNRWLSLIAGYPLLVPQYQKDWSRGRKYSWVVYGLLSSLCIICQIFFGITDVVLHFSFDKMMVALCGIVYLMQIFTKYWLLIYYRKTVEKALDMTIETSKFLLEYNAEEYVKHLNKYYHVIKVAGSLKVWVEPGSIVFMFFYYTAMAYVLDDDETRGLVVESYPPWPSHGNPGYYITTGYLGVVFIAAALSSTVVDFLVITLLTVASVQLQYLQILLTRLFTEHEEMLEADAKADQCEIEAQFRRILILHQRVFDTMKLFKECCSGCITITAVVVMFNMFVGGILCLSDSSWDLVHRILVMVILVSNMFMLYIMSALGDNVEQSNSSLYDDVPLAQIQYSTRYMQQCVYFSYLRSKTAVAFKIFNFCPVSTATFGSLVQMTYSFFITAMEMGNQEEGAELEEHALH